MALSGGSGPRLPSLAELVQEFLPLNRRRWHGHPPLAEEELRRWQELRILLERHLGVLPPPDARARRGSLRVPVRLVLRWAASGHSGPGTTVDLSEGGVRLETREAPAPRTPLLLAITPGEGRPELELGGVIVWIQRASDAKPVEVGVRFVNLDPQQEEALADLVENVLSRV